MLVRPLGLVAMLAALICLAWPAPSRSAIYWGQLDPLAINPTVASLGAANLDGSSPTWNYLMGLGTPGSAGTACGVAVTDSTLYWAGNRGIGRVNLDGPAVPETIVPNLNGPCWPVVGGDHLYWSDGSSIGRANLDGSGVDLSFVPGLDRVCDLAVGGQYLYWVEKPMIARIRIDGSSPEKEFIYGGAMEGCSLAVRDQYLYWGAAGSIARARVDGSEAETGFIAATGSVVDIATDPSHVYWVHYSDPGPPGIGRARLDGGGPNRDWIAGNPAWAGSPNLSDVLGLAVDARPSPPPLLLPARPVRFGKAKHDTEAGAVALDVWVPEWGTLEMSCPGLRCKVIADSVPHPKRGGALRWRAYLKPLKGRPGRRIRAALRNGGVAAVTVRASFTAARTPPVRAVRHLKIRKQAERPNRR